MIRINEAQLTAFGKFSNKRIQFSDGLQVLYGANETGKSTIQLFLRVMLYGVPNQRKSSSVVLRDRERIIPWGERNAEGVLKLTVDGRKIEVHRRFGKTPAGDRTEVLDAVTGEALGEYNGENLGEKLLGIPAEIFEKTFWIRQDSTFPVGTDEELSRRLMNLRDTGEEEVSADATVKVLEQERKQLRAKDKRGTPGVLDVLCREREQKMQERFALQSEMGQRKSAQMRRDAAEARLKHAEEKAKELQGLEERQKRLQASEARRRKWQEVKRLQGLAEQARGCEAYRKFCSLQEETVQNAETIKRKLETLDQNAQMGYDKEELDKKLAKEQQRKKNGIMCCCVGGGLLLLALLLGVLRIPFWLGILLTGTALGLVLLGVGVVCVKNALQCGSKIQQEKERAETEQDRIDLEIQSLQKELSEILEAFSCRNTEELRQGLESYRKAALEAESYQNACQRLLEGEDASTIAQEMEGLQELAQEDSALLRRDIPAEVRQNQKIQMDALSEIKELEGKLSYVYYGGRNPADVQAEIDQLDIRIAEGKTRLKALNLALKVFEKVYETRKSDFTPAVNEKVNGFLDILLEKKYRDIRVSDSYRLRLDTESTFAVEAEYFSRGTYEQIYFALRLSLGELIGDGSEPLFLDDFLASFDDRRAKKAIELLEILGKNRQILLFTCHDRIKEFGAELSAHINDLEEEIEDVC
ncbi:MAG: AAA family ATPase [Clostridia bacterium]|nr:AAA family ATPase [Clostridia bacterium]